MSFLKGILLLIIPIGVFLGGAGLMTWLSGRDAPKGLKCRRVDSETPLNQRLCGYDASAVAAHWKTFTSSRKQAERHFLEIDLVFPFLYGGALLGSLLLGRFLIGRPFSALWIVIPIGIMLCADWIENLVQLGQLQRWSAAGASASASDLQAGWIHIASIATIVKLGVFIGSIAGLLVLATMVTFRWGDAG